MRSSSFLGHAIPTRPGRATRSEPTFVRDLRGYRDRVRSIPIRRKEPVMPELTSQRDLFLHELGDILFVERKLAEEVLPKLIEEVEDKELRRGLERHHTQ